MAREGEHPNPTSLSSPITGDREDSTMRKYRITASSEIRIEYGVELCIGLGMFPESAPLAPVFQAVNDDLATAYEARRATRLPLVKARVAVRFGNYKVDQAIRAAWRAAEIADGGRRGPVSKAAFPDGLAPVVAPNGARQIGPTEALLDRMAKSKVEGMDAFRAEQAPKIEAALSALRAADTDHKAAHKAYVDAFGTELGLRQEHYRALDRIIGGVKAAFPGDRAKQDLVFPEVESAAAASEGDEPEPGAPDGE
jgi:hypothetical protein